MIDETSFLSSALFCTWPSERNAAHVRNSLPEELSQTRKGQGHQNSNPLSSPCKHSLTLSTHTHTYTCLLLPGGPFPLLIRVRCLPLPAQAYSYFTACTGLHDFLFSPCRRFDLLFNLYTRMQPSHTHTHTHTHTHAHAGGRWTCPQSHSLRSAACQAGAV